MLIQKALAFADSQPVAFAFQGGEPTMAGLDYFKYFTDTVRAENKKNSPVYYSIQTNGMLINDEWARFLTKNHFLVGLSLDGDRERNKFRKKAEWRKRFLPYTQRRRMF